MNTRIEKLRTYLLDKQHHKFRRSIEDLCLNTLAENFHSLDMPAVLRVATCFKAMTTMEKPVILEGEKIVFTRTISSVPSIFTEEEEATIKSEHYLHEKGYVCNISPDYAGTLSCGFDGKLALIESTLSKSGLTKEQTDFLQATKICIESLQDLTLCYANHAESIGENDTAEVLRKVCHQKPKTLREALQLLRIVHFAIWEEGNYHNTLGRFDQYMYPYYRHDIDNGILTKEEAFDLIEEFFLTCNKDSDLYPGMQQGDNGQSMVLGGRSPKGEYLFNEVSSMCLRASYELEVIDPKINIRVDKDTPDEIFTEGSKLTKKGLGFPQYSNDDVVIPGLMNLGYDKEDAYNYVVAACWEFIVPGNGMDIPNIDAVSLIKCVKAEFEHISKSSSFDDFYDKVVKRIKKEMDAICEKHKNLYMIPAPMMSVLMQGNIEAGKDISLGNKYNNYGIHGTGIATAVDSLAAIKKYYFDENVINGELWNAAVKDDYEGYDEIKKLLREEAPKFGNDDPEVDTLASKLLQSFSDVMKGRVNERGGIYRAGTGTAMYYIFHAVSLGATPDGRLSKEMIPANYSPTLFFKTRGPLSVIKSFTKPDLKQTINGGPLTLEFDSSVFRNDESIVKLGMLVKTFIVLGGHQLQLNTLCKEKLLDAKKHPENYRNLIVRVWGWSGYFVELDECYQNHVINRIEFGIQ